MAAGRTGTFFLLIVLLGACQAQLKAGCKFETLRACGSDFIPYFNQSRLYESGQEFTDGCARDKSQIACTSKFVKDCLEGLPQAAALLAVKGMEENKEAVCSVGSEKYNEHQKSIKCLNSVGAKLHACIRELHGILQRVLAKVPAKDVIGHTCCRYYDTHDCVSGVLNPCESVGGKKYLLGVVEQVLGETLEFVCGRYTRGSDKCKALPAVPQLGAKDRRIENLVELLVGIGGTIGKRH